MSEHEIKPLTPQELAGIRQVLEGLPERDKRGYRQATQAVGYRYRDDVGRLIATIDQVTGIGFEGLDEVQRLRSELRTCEEDCARIIKQRDTLSEENFALAAQNEALKGALEQIATPMAPPVKQSGITVHRALAYHEMVEIARTAFTPPAALAQQEKWPTLLPFVAAMRHELDANADKGTWKGDHPLSLALEVYYHVAKLQKGVKDGDKSRVLEHAADVANMAMMVADTAGALDAKGGAR